MRAKPPEQDIPALRPLARMPLKALPLEVLDRHPVFLEFFADGIAEDRQATVVLPIGTETATEIVTGIPKVGPPGGLAGGLDRGGTVQVVHGRHVVSEQAKLDIVALGPTTRPPLEASTLKIL